MQERMQKQREELPEAYGGKAASVSVPPWRRPQSSTPALPRLVLLPCRWSHYCLPMPPAAIGDDLGDAPEEEDGESESQHGDTISRDTTDEEMGEPGSRDA